MESCMMLGRLNRITAYFSFILSALAWAIFVVCCVGALRIWISVQYPEQFFPCSFSHYWKEYHFSDSEKALFLPKSIAEKAYASALFAEQSELAETEKIRVDAVNPEEMKAEAHQHYASLREKVLQEGTSSQWKDIFVPGIFSLIMGVLLYGLARRCSLAANASFFRPTFCAMMATILMGYIGLHTYSSVDFLAKSVWPYLFPKANQPYETWKEDTKKLLEVLKNANFPSEHGRQANKEWHACKNFELSLDRVEEQSLQKGTPSLENMAEGVRLVLNARKDLAHLPLMKFLRDKECAYTHDLYTSEQLFFLQKKKASTEKSTVLELLMVLLVELMLFRGIVPAKAKEK